MFTTWVDPDDDGRGIPTSSAALHEPLREGEIDVGAVDGPCAFLEEGEGFLWMAIA